MRKISKPSIEAKRHSLAHLLAMAVLKKFPKAKLGIGPTIENGFYYDFDVPKGFRESYLREFEKSMRDLIRQKLEFKGRKVTTSEVRKIFKDQPFKLELIKEYAKEGRQLSIYATGDFVDLCKGGHVSNTSEINPEGFKLTRIAGAYWRGSEKNPQLQRIYALAFDSKNELEEYLKREEKAKTRDHRKLGEALGLFTIIDEIGPGLPLFYPKGTTLRTIVENYVLGIQKRMGYEAIWIPHLTKGELYKISGHIDKYEALYPPIKIPKEADYYIKSMNCPHFMMLYKTSPHSYRDLPLRWTAMTTNYRYEKSGELSGLTRVRSLTQDDCHVFARPDQIEDEINLMLDMIDEVYKKFEFNDFWVRISTHDPKKKALYIGDPKLWKESEDILIRLMKRRGWRSDLVKGEAAFYGPKLDFMVKDVLGREWQLSTIQLDMNLPKRFKLEYIDSEGKKKEPIVIHRAILGSTERFLGILIEHYAGAFPFWLAPVQVQILTINERVIPYAQRVKIELLKKEMRIELDARNESIGKKIREAELQKIPYIIVIGDKETTSKQVSVRERHKGDIGSMSLEDFIKLGFK